MTTTSRKELARMMAEDLLRNKVNGLFTSLKALESDGLKGSAEWNTLWTEYHTSFRKLNGYQPHWAR